MKYWYALRYGSKETKLYICSVLVGGLLTVAASGYAIGKRSWIGGLVALFLGIVTLIIWQSKTLSDQEIEEPEKPEEAEKPEKLKKLEKLEKLRPQVEPVKRERSVLSEKAVRSEPERETETEEQELESEMEESSSEKSGRKKEKKETKAKKEKKKKEKETRIKKEKRKKTKKERSGEEREETETEGLSASEELDPKELQLAGTAELTEAPKEKNEPQEPKEQTVSDYNTYSPAVLKKAMHRYRVKREHRPVMIDSCPSKGIRECPAYLWKDRHKAYLLLLEKMPRRIEYPLEKMTFLDYQRGVESNPDREYLAFQKKSPVSSVFGVFLPDYYQRRKNGVISDLKNLYVMAGDLAFTNTSVKNVMEVLKPGFRVKDAVTASKRYGAYFIESYEQNILLRDRVLEVDEYKERMKVLLQRMAQEETSLREFRHRLEELVEYRFITEEFADYFLEYRARLEL